MRKIFTILSLACVIICTPARAAAIAQPNILFCISDDQSYAHAGANGDPVIKTPAFDRIARVWRRVVFAYAASRH